MPRYSNVWKAVNGSIWVIEEAKLHSIVEMLEMHSAGMVTADAVTLQQMAAEQRERSSGRSVQNIGVLPIMGTISQRAGLLEQSSGGTSTEAIASAFDRLLTDDSVGSIVLQIDSPGGTLPGIPELGEKIYQARGRKPIVAVADSYAASGGYWLASAADEIVSTPSGEVGSIGVLAIHENRARLNEKLGVERTYVKYGEYKAELNRDAPLSDETKAEIQRRVDATGRWFDETVARNRGVTVPIVQERFGRGRVYAAEEAKARGMIDRVATLEQVLGELLERQSSKSGGMRRSIAARRLDLSKAV